MCKYMDKAAIGKRGACHLVRHTIATLMPEGAYASALSSTSSTSADCLTPRSAASFRRRS